MNSQILIIDDKRYIACVPKEWTKEMITDFFKKEISNTTMTKMELDIYPQCPENPCNYHYAIEGAKS